ncbi:MAG: spermidine synthase [Caulobacterales bacterium 32-69-10]|nr:MAG: spermidine synthase [Caulobacterales bacterium 32-69-10]
MTDMAIPAPRAAALPGLFAGAVFMSAALVFLVEPMMGKLILPLLGGSPAVWNTSLAFFQIALLVGYAYAHGLQRWIRSVRAQAVIHVAVLLAAALTLPLRLSAVMGEPPAAGMPALWLMGMLTLSIGAPFAALSATAPLLQAWYARTRGGEQNPYVLYAASNLGSLLALLAYPAIVEPLLTLSAQRGLWSGGYGLFVLLAGGLALFVARTGGDAPVKAVVRTAPTPWGDRLVWVALAAVPSSLMLGTTSHITTDVASAPFLWVAPLGLYLLTFVIAFQARPLINRERALLWQAPAACACVVLLPFPGGSWPLQLSVHLVAFFLTALVCHQALAARRPAPEKLTEFYLLMSVGGVIGGGFNAFLAPMLFNYVWEYPIALALAGLARPWGTGRPRRWEIAALAGGLAAAAVALALGNLPEPGSAFAFAALAVALSAAFLLRDRGPMFAGLLAAALLAGELGADFLNVVDLRRSFFGVHKVTDMVDPAMRPVRLLFNGTTVHGAQMRPPANVCQPMSYYSPHTPIGQVFTALTAPGAPPLRIGTVGLGAGAVAAFTRPGDSLRFFEIDPAVLAVARDSGSFSYLTTCAHGAVDYRLGDARLTLAREPAGAFDLLLIDAFSSDAVPTHLLTVEAMRSYLDKLAPGGVLLLHLTNRNLELTGPAAAVAREIGAASLQQLFTPTRQMGPSPEVTPSGVMMLARTEADLARFKADPRWTATDPGGSRPWSDDYTNILGALVAHMGK